MNASPIWQRRRALSGDAIQEVSIREGILYGEGD